MTEIFSGIKNKKLIFRIEIAVTDYTSAVAAAKGGADRIELCSALSEGGITPSYGVVSKCKEALTIPIFPIIRPRAGDFLYTDDEFDIIKKDVLAYRQLGCDGIVTGFLLQNGDIDKDKTAQIVSIAYPLPVTFHRAFDRCNDPFKALEDIIETGCKRILTSGQKPKAIESIVLLQQMVTTAKDRIIIMPGSGVRKENIREIAEKTGVTEFHSSVKTIVKSQMSYIHPAFSHANEDYIINTVKEEDVRNLCNEVISIRSN